MEADFVDVEVWDNLSQTPPAVPADGSVKKSGGQGTRP